MKASYSVRGSQILSFASICISENIQPFRLSVKQKVPTVPLLEIGINCAFCSQVVQKSRCLDKRTCCKDYIELLAAGAQHMINVSDIKHHPIIFRSLK